MPLSDGVKALIGAGVAGGAGLGIGRYLSPKAFGYEDNDAAVNMSTALDSLGYGAVGAGLAHPGFRAKILSDPANFKNLITGVIATQLLPVGMDLMTSTTDSMKKLPISNQLEDAANSNTGRGAITGGTLGALAGMGTGLMTAQGDDSRLAHVLKHMGAGALLGGGGGAIIGSHRGDPTV